MNNDEYTTLKDELLEYLRDFLPVDDLHGPSFRGLYAFVSVVVGSMRVDPAETVFMAAEMFEGGERM